MPPSVFFKGGHQDPYFVLIFCISLDGFTIQTSRNDAVSTRHNHLNRYYAKCIIKVTTFKMI